MNHIRPAAFACVVAAAASLASFGTLRAQEPSTAPATTAPAEAQSLEVVVAEVRGMVRVRSSPEQPWQKAVVGMTLGEGAEFQTGPKSAVVCTIENDQTIVLDRLGVVSVSEAVKRGNSVKTDLVMKYGRTEYEIESAGAKHDSTIRSPSSTLAVRGTRVNLYDQPPFTPSAESYTGRAVYQYAKRQTAIGGVGRGAVVRSDRGTAAESALGETVVDPSIAEARTPSDARFVENETSRGGITSFDDRTNIAVVKGGPGAPGDAELASFLPGRFNVIARWTGNQDLNLVLDPQFFPANEILDNIGFFADKGGVDEILFPGFGQNTTATGGRTDFDHRGGANGGYEVGYYDNPRTGIYGIIVLPGGRGGNDPASVKIQAFLDGNPIDMVFPQLDEQGNLIFDADGFVELEIAEIIERVVTPDETNVAGFTFVPSLDELLGEPIEESSGEGETASARSANNRAARKAALKAERDTKAFEKKQAIEARLAERDQRRLAKESGRSPFVPQKAGSAIHVPIGPTATPRK